MLLPGGASELVGASFANCSATNATLAVLNGSLAVSGGSFAGSMNGALRYDAQSTGSVQVRHFVTGEDFSLN